MISTGGPKRAFRTRFFQTKPQIALDRLRAAHAAGISAESVGRCAAARHRRYVVVASIGVSVVTAAPAISVRVPGRFAG
jgi:hypothetical protein